jgi:hypothetical protein
MEKDSKLRCTSCGISVESDDGWVEFTCPECSKERIVRCDKCKKLENSYVCRNCGFTGP